MSVEAAIDRVTKEFLPDPKGIPAAGTYLAALLISVVIVLPEFTASGDKRLMWLFLAALFGLVLLRVWTVAAMFVLLQMKLGVTERMRPVSQLTGGELVFGIAVVVMLISASRLVSLIAPMVAPDATMFGLLRTIYRRLGSDPREDQNAIMPARQGKTFTAMEGLTGLLRAVCAVLVAVYLLAMVPLDQSTRDTVLLFEWAVRPITLGVILIVIYQLTNAVLSTLAWRGLSKPEARVYLRSELVEWPHRDIRGVVKRQVRDRGNRRRT